MSEAEGQSDRSVGRLVGFTDSVVAIAITLIVLPLVDSARSIGPTSASDWLSGNALSIFAAALSFVLIASFWKDHHRLYRQVTGSTALLVNLNLLWLASIIFLPLPTVLIVDSPGHDPVAVPIYIATIVVAQIALRLQELVIVRAELMPAALEPSTQVLWADWVVVALTVASLVVALTIPATGLYSLLLTLLARPIGWAVRRGVSKDARSRRIF